MISANSRNHITRISLLLVSNNMLLTSSRASSTASSIPKFLLTGNLDLLSRFSEFLYPPPTAWIHSHTHIFRLLFQQDSTLCTKSVLSFAGLFSGRVIREGCCCQILSGYWLEFIYSCVWVWEPQLLAGSCLEITLNPLPCGSPPNGHMLHESQQRRMLIVCVFLFSFFSLIMCIVLTSLICFIPLLYFHFHAVAFMIPEVKQLKLV